MPTRDDCQIASEEGFIFDSFRKFFSTSKTLVNALDGIAAKEKSQCSGCA